MIDRKMQRSFHALIASDLDGTLLPQPGKPLAAELFPVLRRLQEQGILFCISSGRSYDTLKELLLPVADEIAYVTENGAQIYAGKKRLRQILISKQICKELIAEIHARPDCEVRINAGGMAYRIAKDELIGEFRNRPGVKAMLPIHAPEEIHGAITKISAFCPIGIHEVAETLLPRWNGRINGSVTGAYWLDFTASDKGTGLQTICEHYQIEPQYTIAFGDHWNDVSMLSFAKYAYVMTHACDRLRQKFPLQCNSVLDHLRRFASMSETDFIKQFSEPI